MDFARVLLVAECVLWVLMIFSVIAHKTEILAFKPAFGTFVLALLLSVIIVLLSLIVGLVQGRIAAYVPALVCAVLPVLAIVIMVGQGLKAPKIHDISTRFDPPLEFDAAKKQRKPGENSLQPASESVRAQQQAHYSDVEALSLEGDLASVYQRVLASVQETGWKVIGESAPARLEAVAETKMFGFKDDIVIELEDLGGGQVRIDMRSVSRVGVSDLGANAARIKAFLKELEGGR